MFLSLTSQSSLSKFLNVEKEDGTYNTKPFSVFTGGVRTQQKGQEREEGSTVILLAPSSIHIVLINSVTSAFLDGPIAPEKAATTNSITFRQRMTDIMAADLAILREQAFLVQDIIAVDYSALGFSSKGPQFDSQPDVGNKVFRSSRPQCYVLGEIGHQLACKYHRFSENLIEEQVDLDQGNSTFYVVKSRHPLEFYKIRLCVPHFDLLKLLAIQIPFLVLATGKRFEIRLIGRPIELIALKRGHGSILRPYLTVSMYWFPYPQKLISKI